MAIPPREVGQAYLSLPANATAIDVHLLVSYGALPFSHQDVVLLTLPH